MERRLSARLIKPMVLLLMLLMLLVSAVQGEQITVNYTEPVATPPTTPTLARTIIFWCYGSTCENWREASRQESDDGNGGDAKSIPINIELIGGTLPITIRVKVAVMDTSGNITAGTITSHAFSAP